MAVKKKMQDGGKAKPMSGAIGAYNKLKGKDLELEKKTNLKFGDGPGSGPSTSKVNYGPLGTGKPKMKSGGSLKPVDKAKKPGLAKLPTAVRNKMGFKKDGGTMKKCKSGCY